MTAFASQQAGNWSRASNFADSPWYDNSTQSALSAVPANGDTVTITHVVTVDAATTVGTSPVEVADWGDSADASIVVVVGTGGSIVIGVDQTLTVRGSIYLGCGANSNFGTGLDMLAGSTLTFDASQAADDQSEYMLLFEQYAQFRVRGTALNRAAINSLATYGRASFASTLIYYWGQCGDAEYCDFERLGQTDRNAIYAKPASSGTSRPYLSRFVNCLFDDCGEIRIAVQADGGIIEFTDNVVQNETIGGTYVCQFGGILNNSAAQEISRNLFYTEKPVHFFSSNSLTVEDNYFHSFFDCYENPDQTGLASFSGNFARRPGGTGVTGAALGSFSGNYLLYDYTEPNYSLFYAVARLADTSIEHCVLDTTLVSTQEQSDVICYRMESGRVAFFRNNIFLPSASGYATGKFISDAFSDENALVDIEHNTFVSSTNYLPGSNNETGIGVGEVAADKQAVGKIRSFKSNLIWTPPGISGGFKIARYAWTTFQDLVQAANCVANWGWNLEEGSEGNGYHCGDTGTAMFSTGTPDDDAGAGNGNPGFVDVNLAAPRCVATFDTLSLGNAVGTAWATATGYAAGDVISNTDAGFYASEPINFRCIASHASGATTEPGVGADWRTKWELQSLYRLREDITRIADLYDWVRAGYVVTNADLNNAGHDGETIGAMGYVAPTLTSASDSTVARSITRSIERSVRLC